jgi:hypothetical protein
MLNIINAVNKLTEPNNTCIGARFRGYSSTFYTGGKLETRTGIRFLKSKSCIGCPKCSYYEEYFSEHPELIIGLNTVEDGRLYRVCMVSTSYDYESGCDDYEIRIIEVNEDAKKH